MNQLLEADTQAIVLDEVFPHAPRVLWKALTSRALIGRWLMPAEDFEAVIGNHFTFQTKPAGEWDGTIRCEVVDVKENQRLSYTWAGGHENNGGYGSKLETLVTITLSAVEGGTRLRLIHSGFLLPRNEVAYRNMSDGWKTVAKRLGQVVAEDAAEQTLN
jgi:uncharacterized protein YndB with AHSA1/START domain